MENSYPNTQAKLLIAKHLDIPVWKVQFWFSNERKRLKKTNLISFFTIIKIFYSFVRWKVLLKNSNKTYTKKQF